MDIEIIKKVLELGYHVYMFDVNHTFMYYEKDGNIGYLQADNWTGIDISTVNEPDALHGTGYQMYKNIRTIDLEKYLPHGFISIPSWARPACKRAKIRKYAGIDDFRKTSKHPPHADIKEVFLKSLDNGNAVAVCY